LKLVLGVLMEPAQLFYAHERQQSWFQTNAELQREPQLGMSRREGQDLGSYLAFNAEAAEELKMVARARPRHHPTVRTTLAAGVAGQDRPSLRMAQARYSVIGRLTGL
jgi:hypothetical protein